MSLSPSAQSQSQTPSQRAPTKKRKRAEHDAELLPLLQGPPVEIIVGTGDETKSWTLPVVLLAHHSGYFRVTLCDPVKQETPTTNQVTLADRPASIFAIFVQWIYTDTIPKRFDLSRLSTGNTVSNSFQLWTLGDYLQAGEFKTRIISELGKDLSHPRRLPYQTAYPAGSRPLSLAARLTRPSSYSATLANV